MEVDWIKLYKPRDSSSIPIRNIGAVFLNLVVMESAQHF